ncbi:MAG: nucleoside recognition domain-containing protein, partial [Chthoniobacteraceae bacterium]
MLNVIWLAIVLVAVLVGGFSGRLEQMTEGAFTQAADAVMKIALPLVGLMAIWLGMMRLAERAGFVKLLARTLRPVMRRLFPDVPAEHPAMGAMVMNMSANMLGLGNAATPLGLRAMALLQKLNPHPTVASNAMVTFLAVNTASLQLIPTTAISILAVQGGKSPSNIVMPAILATAFAMTCGVVAARLLSRLRVFRVQPDTEAAEQTGAAADAESVVEKIEPRPLSIAGRWTLAVFLLAIVWMLFALVWPSAADALPATLGAKWRHAIFWPDAGTGLRVLRAISMLAVPFLLAFIPLTAALR